MNKFPKILFVDIIFRYDNSAGITISKLVSHIPRENLFLVSHLADEANIDIFSEKYQITGKEYKNRTGAKITLLARKQNKSENKSTLKGMIKSVLLNVFRLVVGGKIINRQYAISESLKKWLDIIKPDYIYTNPSTLEEVIFSMDLSFYTSAKIIIHVLDDKVNGTFPGISGFFYKRRFKKRFEEIVKKSDLCLSISEPMARHFESVYNKIFFSFHNPVNEQAWLPYIKRDLNVNRPWTVIYSGMIEANSSSLLKFCESLAILEEKGEQFTFKLYARFNSELVKKKLRSYKFVEVFDFVSQDTLPQLLSSADILFLPLSFRKKHSNLHYSMPTKVTEYLMSGVPTLVFAPELSSVAKYSTDHNVACVVSKFDVDQLCKAIDQLINDHGYRELLSSNAVSRILNHHTVQITNERFNALIVS